MFCKRCGAALPSHGFICKNCGTMMDRNQIREQKEYLKNHNEENVEVSLLSDRYRHEPIVRDTEKKKENKLLGGLLILLVLIVLIIIAFLKVM